MSLLLNLMCEEILFIVNYFISVRHKHTAGLHCDMVLRNVHEIKCKMFSLFVCYVFHSKKITVLKYGHRHTPVTDP